MSRTALDIKGAGATWKGAKIDYTLYQLYPITESNPVPPLTVFQQHVSECAAVKC